MTAMRRLLATAALLALCPLGAAAQSLALVLGTEDYERLPDLPNGDEMTDAVDGLWAWASTSGAGGRRRRRRGAHAGGLRRSRA
jgi:hypothetical protein